MHIVIAPGRLKPGITESAMLAASDRFQDEFVVNHPDVLRRVLVADASGGYADVVYFTDEAAIGRVMEAEQTSDVCREFMDLWQPAPPAVYSVLRTYP